MTSSTIREILRVTQRPDVISFGGGLPAPELFPTEAIAVAGRAVMEREGAAALQYSVSEGILPLRRWLAERMGSQWSVPCSADDMLIMTGSQQALDLIGKIFLDPGDLVLLENPSYLGAIQAFDAYEARYVTVETDDDGLMPASLERILSRLPVLPKLLYTVPNFQNPTGRTLAVERREAIVRICERYAIPILEDDPYSELRFSGSACADVGVVPVERAGLLLWDGIEDRGPRTAGGLADGAGA